MHKNNDINDEYLEPIPQNDNLLMGLAMQIISNDKTVKNETVQNLK